MITSPLARMRATMAAHANFGLLKKTPGRVPRQIPPELIKRAYAAELGRLVSAERVRAAFAPLLAALPRLLESAAADRRHDADEGKQVRALISQARGAMARDINQADIEALARKFAAQTATHQRIQLNRQTRSALGIDVLGADARIPPLVQAYIDANVGLIGGIPDAIASGTEAKVMTAIQTGTLHADLAKQLDAQFQFGERRAKLIARDQVGKLYGQINMSRQRDLGITSFIWRTVHDDRVRDEHEARDGETYRWDDPPDGEIPGEPINCRCNAEPDFSELLGSDDEEAPAPEEPESDAPNAGITEVDDPAKFADDLVPDDGLSAAEQQAVYDWQGGKYVDINDYARSGKLHPGTTLGTKKEANATIAALDRAIAAGETPRAALLFRGIGSGTREGVTGTFDKVGNIVTDRGFSATSLSRAVAEDFTIGKAGPTLLEIEVPKGTRAVFVPAGGGLSESETLLGRGSKFKVLEIRTRVIGGQTVRVARVRLMKR